jgi:hypothetical protein
MAVIKGSGSGTINLDSYNVPCSIQSFIISNLEPSSTDATVYISNGTTDYIITAKEFTLKANQAYVRDSPVYVDKDHYIKIVSTATIGYYFSID